MSRRPDEDVQITEAELTSLTRQLDDMHESTFPGVQKALDEYADDLTEVRRSVVSRRNLLVGAGGVLALGALAACETVAKTAVTAPSPSGATPRPSGSGGTGGGAGGGTGGKSIFTGDLKIVALAAALENLAVAAYTGALKKAAAGQLGTVPPAIAGFITTARRQHSDHAAAWNAVLTKANLPAIKGTPLTIAAPTIAKLNQASTVSEVAKLALSLENSAADTYTFAVANVKNKGGIMTAASIQPVEAMHAAILNFVLGQYPVPDAFISTADAVSPSVLTK